MDLELTPDQRELHAVARQLLDDAAPLARAREFLEGGGAAGELARSLGELGWYAVGTDGDDFGIPGLCLLAEQVGAHAAPTLLVDTAVAVRLARAIERPGPLAARVAAGELATALAVLEPEADWSLAALASRATPTDDGWTLDAAKLGVQHGRAADALAIVADVDGEPGVFFVAADGDGIERAPETGLDPASAPVALTVAGVAVAADDALTGPDAAAALEHALAVGAVAAAAEGHGAAAAALDLAVDYAREREQFGRPIGQFQALQHVLAAAHVDRETTWSSVLFAAAALEESLDDALATAAIAKAQAARASRAVVETALQVLGGIAFTWEHDAHLLQRRVLSCERRFGDAIDHERALGAALAERAAVAVS